MAARARRGYAPHDWLDPRVEVRESPIGGLGAFTSMPVVEGEVLIVWGGELFTSDELHEAEPHSSAGVGEGLFLGQRRGEQRSVASYTNHSCGPTLWVSDEVTLVARRPLEVGAELTLDYATFEPNEGYVLFQACRCGSPLCRGRITGGD